MDKNLIYLIAILAVAGLVVATYGFIIFEGEISDLNGSISDIDGKLTDDSTAIAAIESQLDAIQDQISGYQSAIGILEEQIIEYQDNITQLQEELNQYKEITLVDSMGNVVSFTEPPERIVSLAPSNTEILFAVGAGDSVVGVTDFCDYPYNFTAWVEAGNMTSIGNYYQPSVEPIVTLDPDLVLASSGSLDAAATLKNLGYAVLVVEGHTINDILEDILLVGRATYKNAEASILALEMRTRMDAVATQLLTASTTPKVYHEVWGDPLYSVGPGTFIDELITLAGGTNIFNDATESWPVVSSEAVISKNPDVMFFPDMYMGVGNFYDTIETVASRPGWDSITAVQNSALYEIDADIISRTGPRIVDALEEIAKMVHPEIFGEP
jgi:iron complex transport system substrate-binding protein